MTEYLRLIAEEIGIPIFLLIIMAVWSAFWKFLALWKSGRRNHPGWFVVFALINTLGILEILYVFIFSEMKPKRRQLEQVQRQRARRRR